VFQIGFSTSVFFPGFFLSSWLFVSPLRFDLGLYLTLEIPSSGVHLSASSTPSRQAFSYMRHPCRGKEPPYPILLSSSSSSPFHSTLRHDRHPKQFLCIPAELVAGVGPPLVQSVLSRPSGAAPPDHLTITGPNRSRATSPPSRTAAVVPSLEASRASTSTRIFQSSAASKPSSPSESTEALLPHCPPTLPRH
jgi:hypothetical protein